VANSEGFILELGVLTISRLHIVLRGVVYDRNYGRMAAPSQLLVKDRIAQFQSYSGSADGFVQFSPNGEYLAAYVERGLVSADRVQGSCAYIALRTLRRFYAADPTQSLPRLGGRSRRRNKEASDRFVALDGRSAGIAFLQCVTSSSCQLWWRRSLARASRN